jgi:hypothetical protein
MGKCKKGHHGWLDSRILSRNGCWKISAIRSTAPEMGVVAGGEDMLSTPEMGAIQPPKLERGFNSALKGLHIQCGLANLLQLGL